MGVGSSCGFHRQGKVECMYETEEEGDQFIQEQGSLKPADCMYKR